MDENIFWYGLCIAPAIWGIFFICNSLIFEFYWSVVCLVALNLGGANVVGYLKCKKSNFIIFLDWKEKAQHIVSKGAFSTMKNLA